MSLSLHCGSVPAERADIDKIITPPSTATHCPIGHGTFLDLAENRMRAIGLTVDKRRYGLNHDGNDLFATFEITKSGEGHGAFTNLVGLRNSHIKHFSAGLVTGARVFVCDNLSINGEITMKRRHTPGIMNTLPHQIDEMVDQLSHKWKMNECRYDGYHDTVLTSEQVHDLVMLSFREGAIASSKISKVMDCWDTPPHEEFEPRTAWSLFNAFTEVHKDTPGKIIERSRSLHTAFDTFCEPAVTVLKYERGMLEDEYAVTTCPYEAYDQSGDMENQATSTHPDQQEFSIE